MNDVTVASPQQNLVRAYNVTYFWSVGMLPLKIRYSPITKPHLTVRLATVSNDATRKSTRGASGGWATGAEIGRARECMCSINIALGSAGGDGVRGGWVLGWRWAHSRSRCSVWICHTIPPPFISSSCGHLAHSAFPSLQLAAFSFTALRQTKHRQLVHGLDVHAEIRCLSCAQCHLSGQASKVMSTPSHARNRKSASNNPHQLVVND